MRARPPQSPSRRHRPKAHAPSPEFGERLVARPARLRGGCASRRSAVARASRAPGRAGAAAPAAAPAARRARASVRCGWKSRSSCGSSEFGEQLRAAAHSDVPSSARSSAPRASISAKSTRARSGRWRRPRAHPTPAGSAARCAQPNSGRRCAQLRERKLAFAFAEEAQRHDAACSSGLQRKGEARPARPERRRSTRRHEAQLRVRVREDPEEEAHVREPAEETRRSELHELQELLVARLELRSRLRLR
jgi:hypothetical protein